MIFGKCGCIKKTRAEISCRTIQEMLRKLCSGPDSCQKTFLAKSLSPPEQPMCSQDIAFADHGFHKCACTKKMRAEISCRTIQEMLRKLCSGPDSYQKTFLDRVRRPGSKSPVASCAVLWHPVASCGSEVRSPILEVHRLADWLEGKRAGSRGTD